MHARGDESEPMAAPRDGDFVLTKAGGSSDGPRSGKGSQIFST